MNPDQQPSEQQPSQSSAPTPPFIPAIPRQPTQYAQPAPIAAHNPSTGFGIASLILSIIGLGALGIIFGAIAMSKSHKSGHGMSIMGLIGIIWGIFGTLMMLLLSLLVLSNFSAAQSKARDSQTIARINSMSTQLEVHYNDYGYYPDELTDKIIAVADGTTGDAKITDSLDTQSVNSTADASRVAQPTLTMKYQYIPIDCTEDACKGFVLRGYLERPTTRYKNPYTKTGLFNL